MYCFMKIILESSYLQKNSDARSSLSGFVGKNFFYEEMYKDIHARVKEIFNAKITQDTKSINLGGKEQRGTFWYFPKLFHNH